MHGLIFDKILLLLAESTKSMPSLGHTPRIMDSRSVENPQRETKETGYVK